MAGPLGKATIGKLRHRATIQWPDDGTRNEFKEIEKGLWTDVATVWCHVEPKGGREEMRSQTVQANVTHTVVMRARDGLTPKHRILWKKRNNQSVVLNIVSVGECEGDENAIELQCLREM